jgi:predicted nucleotidyltransferase
MSELRLFFSVAAARKDDSREVLPMWTESSFALAVLLTANPALLKIRDSSASVGLSLARRGRQAYCTFLMTILETVLDVASRQLPAGGVDCILIGGFAVNYHGYTRNTLDVDFMVVSEQLDAVRQIMTRAGFTNISIENNVAFFSAPSSPLRVDFLRVDGGTMSKLLANAVSASVHGYRLKVPALKDLIAMKIFALSQDIARRMGKDLPDIAYLSVLHDLDLESEIRPLCSRFGTQRIYDLIRDQVEALRTA